MNADEYIASIRSQNAKLFKCKALEISPDYLATVMRCAFMAGEKAGLEFRKTVAEVVIADETSLKA